MAQTHETAWDIHAKRLFPCGFGHALVTQREVEVGDVGSFHGDGEFTPLFNCINDGVNIPKGDSFGFGPLDTTLVTVRTVRDTFPRLSDIQIRAIESKAHREQVLRSP